MFISIFILFTSVVYAKDNIRITAETTAAFTPGCKIENSSIYKIDVGTNLTKPIWKDLYWDREAYLTAIYNDKKNDNALTGGGGFRLRTGYSFTDNLNIFIGSGLVILFDGGCIDGLAQTFIYGTIEGGIEYKRVVVGFNHMSSPFHDSSDGDSGFNTIYVGWNF